jgi:hypothetical protein
VRRCLAAVFILPAALLAATPVSAQDRPFLFSVATTVDPKPAVRFDYDVGVGERAFQSDVSNRPEQRVGVQASYGRLTFLARFGIAEVGSSYESSQSGEVLFSMLGRGRPVSLAAGGGVLHEPAGGNVLLARVMGGRATDASQLQGNLLFQKPLSSERDAVDLITSVGWARRLSRAVSLGVEAIGEDLEGFWEEEEAEGGARLLVGPSLHIAPAGRRWQLTATGGPLFHPTDNRLSSDALRDLPPETKQVSYAFKVAVSISLLSGQ